MSLEQRIYERLHAKFQPEILEVVNQSHLHAGHAGDDGSGESHFKVKIKAVGLNELSYVARERAVYEALSEEMQAIHALSVQFLK